MFSHVTLGADGLPRARRFHEASMPTLGLDQPFTLPGALVFGEGMGAKLFVGRPFDGTAASHGNGTHVALLAPTRAAVDASHATALAHGGTDERAPGLRPATTHIITVPMSATPTATSFRRSATPRLDPSAPAS